VEKIRLGYVGAGFMAQAVHLPNFTALPDCEVVALAEMRPQLAQKVAQRFGIPRVYTTHSELLLDPDIDAVAVSAHYVHQAQVAEDALQAGKPVFMEKPMALTVERAERMLQAAREGGGRLMVAYMKRYDAGIELAKQLIDQYRQSGELGQTLLPASPLLHRQLDGRQLGSGHPNRRTLPQRAQRGTPVATREVSPQLHRLPAGVLPQREPRALAARRWR
jgi:hypothetical protein